MQPGKGGNAKHVLYALSVEREIKYETSTMVREIFEFKDSKILQHRFSFKIFYIAKRQRFSDSRNLGVCFSLKF